MKTVAKRVAKLLGLELTRYRVATSSAARLQRILAFQQIDLVLDVGANVGQFAKAIREGGYRGKIVSFEPVSAAHRVLSRNSQNDALWVVPPRVAIGAVEGSVDINIAENSFSSSILNVLPAHLRSDGTAVAVSRENVRVAPLDAVAGAYLDQCRRAFLKVDTQGYESHVLAGAQQSLKRIAGVQIELSLVPLYEGQPLFFEIAERMQQAGFSIAGIVPGFADERTGRLLQLDGIFLKDADRLTD